MATIHLEFPVWVRYENQQYIVRPLFSKHEEIANERYERAMKGLSKVIRKQFNQYKMNNDNLDDLLWYLFNPEDLKFNMINFEFTYGQRFFNGNISVVWFTYFEHKVVCLPAFDNYFFIPTKPDARRKDIEEEVIEHLQILARNYKKEYDTEMLLDNYTSTKGEFITSIEMPVFISGEKMSIYGEDDGFFHQFFRQSSDFDGRVEVDKVGYELNEGYPADFNRTYYRENLVEQLNRLVYNRQNVPIVLLGPRRVGKTAILKEAVFRYLERNSEEIFSRLDNIWFIDPSRVIAGMSIVGMWQRRFESIIQFAMHPLPDFPRKDKLYFTNIVALFRIGKSAQNSMTLSDVLKPYMQNRQLQVILEATPEEWDVVSELDRGFTDLFKVIRIPEPNEETTLRIISKVRTRLEQETNFKIDNPGLLRLIELQNRFNTKEVLLGTTAENLQQLASKYSNQEVYSYTVVSEFSQRTHINPRLTDSSETVEKDEFYKYIDKRLIGQSEAVYALTDVMHVIKAQLNNPDRPMSSFLFIGPTGVGKTQAAKVLADYLFTHDDRLVRFDMNEFIDGNAVNRLVGDLYNPEGQLTTKIQYNPYCVLLFDEIEKANPDVHNLLLQVLGEGRLTDALGRTISFNNTVIIMTSNLGAQQVGKEINIQRREDLAQSTYEKAVRDFFRPEFINRIDRVVIFNKLRAEDIAKIAWLQIKDLLKRYGFIRRHTILNVTPEVLNLIAEKGFDPEMGGRALKRQIEKELTILVAEQLVETVPENPVIFNLYLQEKTLKPHIVSLVHIPAKVDNPLVQLSKLEISVMNFEQLLQKVEKVKEVILEFETQDIHPEDPIAFGEDASRSHYLKLKEGIIETEEELRNIIFEYENQVAVDFSQASLKIKAPGGSGRMISDRVQSKVGKSHLQDLYNQLQINEYLEDVYESATRIVRESNILYWELHQKVAWLNFYFAQYKEQGIDEIMLQIVSRVENMGSDEVDFLAEHYESIYPKEELVINTVNDSFLHLRGPGLKTLFASEEGFHMFYQPQESPIPVEVIIHEMGTETDPEKFVENLNESQKSQWFISEEDWDGKDKEEYIIRLYNYLDMWGEDMMVTDLRTGIIHNKPLTKKDWQILFYSNFSKEFQLGLEIIS